MDAIEGEVVNQTSLAVREEPQAPTLFGTSDPVEVIEKAARVATALARVVDQKGLYSNIQGKKYPHVEAWQTIGMMLGLTCVNEWSRRIDGGWEARACVNNSQGRTIGAAEAQCVKSERGKGGWEDYAMRSMAQTRATSKAFRSVLSFVMVLAGYEATPAEEMPRDVTPLPAAPVRNESDALIERAAALGIIDKDLSPADARRDLRLHVAAQGVEFRVAAVSAYLDAYKASEAKPAVPSVDKQQKLAMVLFARLGYDEAQRHDFYTQVAGYDGDGEPIDSWRAVKAADKASRVIDALQLAVKGLPE